MSDKKSSALTGACNLRLNNMDCRNNQYTFPLADVACIKGDDKLTIPSAEDVIHAKEWVDDGSEL